MNTNKNLIVVEFTNGKMIELALTGRPVYPAPAIVELPDLCIHGNGTYTFEILDENTVKLIQFDINHG